VRQLVYLVKHWAKSRHINSPGDGTLSSYGYIMCVLHFLQTRPTPLVPNLQRLPSDWTGDVISPLAPPPEEHEYEINPADNSPCRTYFYRPDKARCPGAGAGAGAGRSEGDARKLLKV
jgi:TUTase nucleotidyltransferase domain